MTIPHTIELESGASIRVNVVGDKVLMIPPLHSVVMTRAECEELADMLCMAGIHTEPATKHLRAKPITSVRDAQKWASRCATLMDSAERRR